MGARRGMVTAVMTLPAMGEERKSKSETEAEEEGDELMVRVALVAARMVKISEGNSGCMCVIMRLPV